MDALLSIIAAVLPATVDGLTMAQWLTIATAVMSAEPEIKAALAALHPAFEAIVGDLAQGNAPDEEAENRLRAIPSEMSGVR
jgi:hypothetical protein